MFHSAALSVQTLVVRRLSGKPPPTFANVPIMREQFGLGFETLTGTATELRCLPEPESILYVHSLAPVFISREARTDEHHSPPSPFCLTSQKAPVDMAPSVDLALPMSRCLPATTDAPRPFATLAKQKMSSSVSREGQPNAKDAAPLDPALFVLSEGDLEFLHKTVSEDNDELKSRIFDIQKKYVVLFVLWLSSADSVLPEGHSA